MTVSVTNFTNGTDSTGAGLTAVVTPSSNPVAGDFLHVCVTVDDTYSISSIASAPSQTWTLLNSVDDATDGQLTAHYTSDALAGGLIAVTVTFNSALADFRAISSKTINGASACDTGAKAGQLQLNPGSGTNAVTSGNTAALAAQPALVSGWSQIQSGGSAPAAGSSPFVSDGTGFTFGGTADMRGESKRVTSTAATAATYTGTAGANYTTLCAVYTEAAAGATRPVKMAGQWGGFAGEGGGFAG